MFALKHSAAGVGTPHTPTLDQRRSTGPISLHNAIKTRTLGYIGLTRELPHSIIDLLVNLESAPRDLILSKVFADIIVVGLSNLFK
jgi:hypothetical protein